jgi:hypothetical protein
MYWPTDNSDILRLYSGMTGKLLNVIRSMYGKIKSCVQKISKINSNKNTKHAQNEIKFRQK